MNVVSLFTGVGGIDLGLERAGMRVVLQCEQDPECQRRLRRHWPGVPLFGDVREVGTDWIERTQHLGGRDPDAGLGDGDGAVREQPTPRGARNAGVSESEQQGGRPDPSAIHLVCGGFPCQDLSVAGARAGLSGERSGLFFEAARVADALLGDGGWLLIENVPGLFSSNGGRDFAIILSTLAELGFHDLAWRVLDSRYFGVPQRRRRVFILARRARGDGARAVLLEPESGGGNHQAGGKPRQAVAASLSRGSSRPGVSAPGRRQEDDANIVGTLDRAGGGADDNDAQAGHIVGTFRSHGRPGSNSFEVVAPTLSAAGHDASEDGTGRQAIVEAPDTDGEGAPTGLPRRVDGSLRPLTCPAEPRPDGPREAQMGNAVTVQVAEWIGRRIVTREGA